MTDEQFKKMEGGLVFIGGMLFIIAVRWSLQSFYGMRMAFGWGGGREA